MAAIRLTRTHRILVGVVVTGAVIIAAIGFAGSYAAVRTLALHKGFGWFANVFPIGVDAGIVVLLALDLLLTWLRIPFPLLRQTAWLLTAATIAFNGAAAWPDKLGVGMHAIIPVLFVVSVEAARHAIGRIADITADKHMESVRITRWLLAPLPTFRLWRRMKLWELRSYEEVIRREQDRLVYRARLRARYGIAWRRKAPVEAIMPLRLARYGVPLAETADAGLEAAGIELATGHKQLTAAPEEPAPREQARDEARDEARGPAPRPQARPAQSPAAQGPAPQDQRAYADADFEAYEQEMYEQEMYARQYAQQYADQYGQPPAADQPAWQGAPHDSPWFAAQQRYLQQQRYAQGQYAQGQYEGQGQFAQGPYPQGQFAEQQYGQVAYAGPGAAGPGQEPGQQQEQGAVPGQDVPAQDVPMVPSGAPGRTRPLGSVGVNGRSAANGFAPANGAPGGPDGGASGPGPDPAAESVAEQGADLPRPPFRLNPDGRTQGQQAAEPEPETESYPNAGLDLPDGIPVEEAYFAAYRRYVREHGDFPNARQFARFLPTVYQGTPPEERELVTAIRDLRYRFQSEADAEHIP
ncbi:DUF2637 domain-containing protein [Streptomyces sp. HPF1205]|uniref:DUF2637 domain-containing protein n=1 Tax=Streptomyces sp. HPF1205 TaxID=2873262 RepID=UPI001CED339F|nr:DUF2637 domain-containing protein [Streptomyces sp. HPF1205]